MPITPVQARAFRDRWRRVARAESSALRRSSLDERLRRLAALMTAADVIGETRRLAAEDRALRLRWRLLRRALRA